MLDYIKENERQFKEAKKLMGFSLRGNNKYYYANQCAIFARNYKKYWEQKKKNSNETITTPQLKIKPSITCGQFVIRFKYG